MAKKLEDQKDVVEETDIEEPELNGIEDGADDQAHEDEVKADEGIVARPIPTALDMKLNGERDGLVLQDVYTDVLTADGKLDRNAVYRLGRLTEDPNFFEVREVSDTGEKFVVATLTRGKSEWHITLSDGKTVTVGRSKTLRPGKAKATGKIDPGPDAYKAMTALIGRLYPDMKQASGGGGGAVTKALKAKVAEQDAFIALLVKGLAQKAGIDAEGLSIEDLTKQLIG